MGNSKCSIIKQRHILCALASVIVIVSTLTRAGTGFLVVAMVNVTVEPSASKSASEILFDRGMHSVGVSTKAPRYNWTRQMQGYILSSFFWGFVALQIVAGSVAQKYGGRWIVVCGMAGCALLDILTPLSASVSPYLMIFATCMKGVFSSLIWPGIFSIFGHWIPPQEAGTIIPLTQIAGSIGQAVGQTYSGIACASDALGGWPSVYYINGALALVTLIPWCIFVYNSPESHPFVSSEEVEFIQQSMESDPKRANKSDRSIPWRRILLSRGVLTVSVMLFGLGWYLMMFMSIVPQYIDEILGLHIEKNSIFSGSITIVGALVLAVISRLSEFIIKREWLSRNVVRKLYFSLGFIGMSSLFLGLTFVENNVLAAIVLLFVSYVFYQFSFLSLFLLMFEISQNYCAVVFGICSSSFELGSIVTPFVADSLTTHRAFAEWQIVFYLTSGVSALFAVIFPLIGSTEREEWDIESSSENEKEGKEEDLLLQQKVN